MILNVGAGGKEGNQVNITPTLTQGIKIADYSIDDISGELYAPQGDGSGNTASRELTPAEYAALSDEEKNNGTVYYVNDGGSSGNVSSNGINYSTEEQNIGLTWIDGKTIYQKSFNISNIMPTNSEYVIMDNVDTLILHNLMFSDSALQNGAWFILSSYAPIVSYWFYGDVLYLNSNNQLIFRIDGRSGILSLKGTIQYTKSTE